LILIPPAHAVAKGGHFGSLLRRYKSEKNRNPRSSIQIWADFDLYHRDDKGCAQKYRNKLPETPDFLFSFHNFEDFLALHWRGDRFDLWRAFGQRGHFRRPLHSHEYLLEFEKMLSKYRKGDVPVGFINWDSLGNLKSHLEHQPKANPHGLSNVRGFGDFLIGELERAYPGKLD